MNDDKKAFFGKQYEEFCRRVGQVPPCGPSNDRCGECPYAWPNHGTNCIRHFSKDFKIFQRIKKLEKLLSQ